MASRTAPTGSKVFAMAANDGRETGGLSTMIGGYKWTMSSMTTKVWIRSLLALTRLGLCRACYQWLWELLYTVPNISKDQHAQCCG